MQVLGLQELFYGPYFCAEQQARWYELTEPVPDGPTIAHMQKLAKRYHMVLVVPVYEVEMTGLYYNTAAVIDADGKYLGKYRKHHIPHCHPGFWEKFYFTPGNAGYPVFQTRYAKVGVYICYDRHFPEGARILGLNGAEIVLQPIGHRRRPLRIFVGTRAARARRRQSILRRGDQSRRHRSPVEDRPLLRQAAISAIRAEKSSRQAGREKDELLVADLNLDEIEEVRRVWQFYRDRRPESYGEITRTLSAGSAQAAD